MIFASAPLLAGVSVFLYLGNRWSLEDCRLLVLRSTLLVGGYLVLLTEGLSLAGAVTRVGLLAGWIVPVLAFSAWAWQKKRQDSQIQLPKPKLPERWQDWLWLAGVVGILGITAVVAWFAPPQTWDSLTYHMSRVAHWAQDRSVWHFATGIDRQDSISPGAEMITLNSYVLYGGDRLSTFTQWWAMLGTMVGVSVAARLLGAKSYGQWLAVYFAITLPIGIVEASSTITDYVVTFWVVCAVVEVLQYEKSRDWHAMFFVSLAFGLAMLTKPISVPYLVPFGVWMVALVIRREKLRGTATWIGVAFLVVGLTNAGYITRNVVTYGGLSNPVDFANHSNQLRTPAGVASTLIKNAGLHAGLPEFFGVNTILTKIVIKTHLMLGLDVMDPRTTGDGEFRIAPPVTQEDLTTNPYHFYLILITLPLVLILWKRLGRRVALYSTLAVSTLVLFSFIFKWHVFSGRYHLPFFVLLGPTFGLVWGSFRRVAVGVVLAFLLVVAARPWLFSIDSRPLVPVEGHSSVDSILAEPREKLYFAGAPGLYDVYKRMTDDIEAKNCSKVGIMLHGNDPEYLLWALLGAPRSDLQLEWIVSSRTSRYSPRNFQPCAVVCTDCEQASIRGLELSDTFGSLSLYFGK
jgi:hypothetical protein